MIVIGGKVRAVHEGRDYSELCNFEFMGWFFWDVPPRPTHDDPNVSVGHVVLYTELENPFHNLTLSFHNYGGNGFTREMAAAWLIAHWWEHSLKICPCLNDKNAVRDDDQQTVAWRNTAMHKLLDMSRKGEQYDVTKAPIEPPKIVLYKQQGSV